MIKVVFRVDASVKIGLGHAVRCMTLANALREKGRQCHFICRSMPDFLRKSIVSSGHILHILPCANLATEVQGYDIWLGASPIEDAEQTGDVLENLKPEWLIVDHYSLEFYWEARQRPYVLKIMVIDDLANRDHDCDLLLDQNLRDGNPYEALVPSLAPVILGSKYALLRPEFSHLRAVSSVRNGSVRRILIFFGGSDPTGDTMKAVIALSSFKSQIKAEVIVGEINPEKEKIRAYCERYDFLHFACQVDDMAVRFARADLCIGAAGSASWERLAVGLPTLIVVQQDNQAENARQLEKCGVGLCLGQSPFVTIETIQQVISELIFRGKERLQLMSSKAFELVDGGGVLRVINAMDNLHENINR